MKEAKFTNFFFQKAPLLLVGYLLIFSISFTTYNNRFALKENEKIQVFSTTYGIKHSFGPSMVTDLEAEGVLDVLLYDYHPAEGNLYKYFTTLGMKSDFHILSETTLSEFKDVVTDYYLPLFPALNNEIPGALLVNYEYYEFEEVAYGLKIFDHTKLTRSESQAFSDIYEFGEEGRYNDNYYLLLNKKSVNLKGYNEEAVTKNAFRALRWLLERYSNE